MKKYKKIVLLLILAFVLVGCKNYITKVDGVNTVLDADLIKLTTSWSSMVSEGNWLSRLFNGILTWPIAQVINYLSEVFHTGPVLALILTTILIKILVFALTYKSTISSQKMQEIQPQVQKIQAKYKDSKDPQAMNKMNMEVNKIYKENGISPMGSMGVMFLQLPILIAMYQAVQRSSAIYHGTIFGASTMLTPSDGLKAMNIGFIVLFLLMVVAQFVSMKLPTWIANSKKKKKVYEKEVKAGNSMNTMTYVMIAMISWFAYTWPISMTLYWMMNSLLQIVQTWVVQKVILERQDQKKIA